MTTFIFLFRILSQPYDALHQKIVSWTVIIQYVYLWSVFNGMPTTDLNGLIKECNVLTVGFFLSRSVGVRPNSRQPQSRPTSTSLRRSRPGTWRRRSASRSTVSRSGSRAPSRRNRYQWLNFLPHRLYCFCSFIIIWGLQFLNVFENT